MSPSKKARKGKGALSTQGKVKAQKRPIAGAKRIEATEASAAAVGAGDSNSGLAASQPTVVVHAPTGILLRFRNAEEIMADKNLKRPDEVIIGVLRKGTRGVFGGPPKVRKSWAAMDLALSVATGTPWLKWPTVKGKVLYVDYEQTEPDFKDRLLLIEAAKIEKGQDMDFSDFINVSLTEDFVTFEELAPTLVDQLQGQNYSLVIIDDLYKALGGKSESSQKAVKEFCSLVGNLSKRTGAAVLVVHHSPKGKINDKPLVDRFAGSGVLTRDAFTLIGLTKYLNPEYTKLEFEMRNFPEQPAVALDWKGALFAVSDTIDLAAFEEQAGAKKEDRSEPLLELLGTEGLTASAWEERAKVEHGIPRASFFREKKKLVDAKKVNQDEKSKRWRKSP